MLYLVLWWVLLVVVSFAALPVTLRFFAFLPDRGYAFAKPVALLLWVYPFWLLASFGFVHNRFGVLAFLLAALALACWGLARGRGGDSTLAWLRANWRYALTAEIVFGVAYLVFAFYRAYNPEISATEKPMEFMFLNSILSSETFPPRDAWLSGYAISYYYLGYVIVAALAKLGDIPSGYAFNLGLIMTFALAAVSAFGLSFNLVKFAQGGDDKPLARPSRAPYVFGIIAVFLLLIIGNFQGVVEVAYNAKLGSRDVYAALNLHGLETVEPSGTGIPEDNWWWWRASRVVNDKSVMGDGHIEIIDEFPAFSFLLGDLHPHVLALPYGVLALAVALNLLLRRQSPISSGQALFRELFTPRMLFTALVVGALGMLNTWDIVTYGAVIAASLTLAQYRAVGKFSRWVLASAAAFLAALFLGGYLLFLPFYLGFSSQAQGVLPQLTKTPLHQFLIMFGLFIFVVASFVIELFARVPDRRRAIREMMDVAIPLFAVPFVIALGGLVAVTVLPSLRELVIGWLSLASQDVTVELFRLYFGALVSEPWVFLGLVVLIAALAAMGRFELQNDSQSGMRTGIVFALLLALVALLLTFGVEFLFIRDTFGTRMNTVFKLYYQAWLLLAMAATFGVFYIWWTTRGIGRTLWIGAFGFLFALSMIYPVLAFPNRANYFQAANELPTLDGWRWVQRSYPDEYAAIEWLRAHAPRDAVILEGAGQQYTFDNRVSVATGLPTVLGWGGHELQWRGNYDEAGPRERDVEQVYKSRDVNETRALLEKYGVDYVVVGSQERTKYQLNPALIDKFSRLGELVFEQGSMRIYRLGQVSVSLGTP